MSTTVWSALAIAVLFAIGYLIWVLGLLEKSRELDRKIDFTKLRKFQDDDRDD